MIDPNSPKFKTHEFKQISVNRLCCIRCSMIIRIAKYYFGYRIDLYENSWFSNSHELHDISMSCNEYIIKNIIE